MLVHNYSVLWLFLNPEGKKTWRAKSDKYRHIEDAYNGMFIMLIN